MLALALAAPLPAPVAPASDSSPTSGIFSAADVAAQLDHPSALVRAAARAQVDGRSLARAVAAAVAMVPGLFMTADAVEAVVSGSRDSDDFHAVRCGAALRGTDPGTRAARKLCLAVLDEEWSVTIGKITGDAEDLLCDAMDLAAEASSTVAVVAAFCSVISWGELVAFVEVES